MRTPLRPGRRLAGRLRRPRAVLPAGRARDRRLGRRRRPGLPRHRPSSPATCSRCAGCRCPTSTRWSRKGIDGTQVELDGEQFELKVRPFPQGAQRHPEPDYDGGKGFTPGRRGQHLPGRGGRTLPGQHQLRPDLPGAGQVQRGQDARQGAADRPRRRAGADGRLQGRTSIPTRAASRTSSTRPTATTSAGTPPGRSAGTSSSCAPTRSRTRG